ncbi:DUF3085 domain-containing protein [Ensifer sp. MPMI2T]|nr:DUF3085 domain-containing protein [Ensifer sp. MPMI2T]
MTLTFTITAVRDVIASGIADAKENGGFRDPHCGLSGADHRKPGLWLVGDHGVYVCSNGALAEGHKPLVAYAEECDPLSNDDWFEVKRRTFGGDDGVDFLDADELEALIAASPGCTHLAIDFSPAAIELRVLERG